MYKFSNFLSQMIYKKGYILENQKNDIRFALEVVFSNFISFMFILFVGILLNEFYLTFIFFIIFITFRLLSDGYHADKFSICLFLTTVTFLFSVGLYKWIPSEHRNHILYFLLIIDFVFILISNQFKLLFRRMSLGFLFLIFILFVFKYSNISLFLISILTIIIISNSISYLPIIHDK